MQDGEYPIGPRFLGQKKPVGQGRVDFPLALGRLKAL